MSIFEHEYTLLSEPLSHLLDELDASPLHHFSLASLENAHTNHWRWLIERNPAALYLFDPLAKPTKKPGIKREKTIGSRKNKSERRLDLWIQLHEDDGRGTYVIENKLKAVISGTQLNSIASQVSSDIRLIVVSLFDYSTVVPSPWTKISYSELADRLESLVKGWPQNRDVFLLHEYLSLVRTLSMIADELQHHFYTEELDLEPSDKHNSLSFGLNKAGLYTTYEKYRMSGFARYLFDQLNEELRSQGRLAGFDLGEKNAEVYFEHGYSGRSSRAFSEIVVPILDGNVRLGVQITRDQFSYFFEPTNNFDEMANMLDHSGLWFQKRLRYMKKDGLRKFGESFFYEYEILEPNCPYQHILGKVRDSIELIYSNKKEIEDLLRPLAL